MLVDIGDIDTQAVVIPAAHPRAPGLGVLLAEDEGTLARVIPPEGKVILGGEGVTRPGVLPVVPHEGVQVGDGVEGGELLSREGMLPARIVGEAVVHLDAVAVQGVGVLVVGGGQGVVQRPILGLGLDVEGVCGDDHVDEAAGIVVLVAALDGIVPPLGVKGDAGGVLVVLLHPVEGLLDEAARVVSVHQVREIGDGAGLVFQVADGTAPAEIDAQLVAVALQVVGLGELFQLLGGDPRQGEGGGLVGERLYPQGGELPRAVALHEAGVQPRELPLLGIQEEILLGGLTALGVGDPDLDGSGGGVGQGEAIELLLKGLALEGVGQALPHRGGGLVQGGVAREGVGQPQRGGDRGGAVFLGDLVILGGGESHFIGGDLRVGDMGVGGIFATRASGGGDQHEECQQQG